MHNDCCGFACDLGVSLRTAQSYHFVRACHKLGRLDAFGASFSYSFEEGCSDESSATGYMNAEQDYAALTWVVGSQIHKCMGDACLDERFDEDVGSGVYHVAYTAR